MVAFKDEHGHCNISHRYERDPSLADWVAEQQQKAKSGEISKDRLKRFIDLYFNSCEESF